jgi:predicted Zn-dependent protease with MMP-like domain
MDRRRFARLVQRALDELPPEYRDRLDGVAIVVKWRPTAADLRAGRVPLGHTLFGLYQGVPLPLQGSMEPLLPAKITIFQQPLEAACPDIAALREQVKRTVWHEIAHHFGISDERLHELNMA